MTNPAILAADTPKPEVAPVVTPAVQPEPTAPTPVAPEVKTTSSK